MKTVEDYCRIWQLANPHIMAETGTSMVYRIQDQAGRTLVLKHLKPVDHEEAGGASLLKWYDKEGAVEVIAYDDNAQLLEFCNGPTLKTIVQQGDDQQATEIITEVTQQLFKARSAPAPSHLIPLQRWFRDLFKKAEQDQKAGDNSLFVRAAATAEKLLATQTHVKPLHGDLHHENILQSDRGWLAIDPKGLIGDVCYEFGNVFRNPDVVPEIIYDVSRINELATVFSTRFDLDRGRMLEFAAVHACLSASWNFLDNQNASSSLKVAELVYSAMEH